MSIDTRYDTCPVCGEKKHVSARTCKGCQKLPQNQDTKNSVNHDLLDAEPEWVFQFVGFFHGEGSAMIIRNNKSFSPCLALRLRDDDWEAIEDIQKHLGGRLLRSNKNNQNANHGNQVEWRCTNAAHCLEICDLILAYSVLPAKKIQDVQQVRDFCEWRLAIPEYWTDEDRLEAERRFQALRESRKYRC